MNTIEITGTLGGACEYVYTLDLRDEPGWVPTPLGADAQPKGDPLAWTAEEIAAYRAGTIIQHVENGLKKLQSVTLDDKGARIAKSYAVIVDAPTLKAECERYIAVLRADKIAINARANAGRIALKFDGATWKE